VSLIREKVLDAELGALLWLLLEGHVPLVVAAAAPGTGRSTLLEAVLAFLPPSTRRVPLTGRAEQYAVLEGQAPGATYLVAEELSDHLPTYTWGPQAQALIRALQQGHGLGTTIDADSLEEVYARLGRPPVSLSEDELRFLGVVLILRLVQSPDGPLRRVVAAHYLRPLERDKEGHLQRRPPAVLATWDAAGDAFEHFAWGVTPELARRVGRSQADLEQEQATRARALQDLVDQGVDDPAEVRTAIQGYRHSAAGTIGGASPH
jgi:hypothetical protein